MILFLVGFMGCGKSTIARRFASVSGFEYVDLDAAVVEREGRSIVDIFAQSGEEYFRTVERQLIEEFSAESDTVVATGGGAACWGDNVVLMKSKGTIVYLKMSPESLVFRLYSGRAKRPKIAGLSNSELRSYVANTLAEREKYYSQATIVINCDGVSESYVVDHIRFVVDMARMSAKHESACDVGQES